MGLDSLMAIELKNKIERQLQTTLPMSAFMNEPSVSSLATQVAETYGGEPTSGDEPPAASAPSEDGQQSRMDNGNSSPVTGPTTAHASEPAS